LRKAGFVLDVDETDARALRRELDWFEQAIADLERQVGRA
jgi:hypothetical protein